MDHAIPQVGRGAAQQCRTRLAAFVLAAAALAAAGACVRSQRSAAQRDAEAVGVFVVETGGYRYEYHAPSGSERLYALADDPHGLVNVIARHEDVAAACHREIESREGVDDLESLHARFEERVRSLHRAVRHVPLVVRFPGPFDGGRRVHDVVRLEDVAPTLLEVCGLGVPDDLDGRSLTHGLTGRVSIAVQGENPNKRRFVESAVPGLDAQRMTLGIEAAYDGRYHFVRTSDGRSELYDETRDPGERENLAPRDPALAARMASMLPRFE